ncbi:UDP-glucose 4-epimerase [Gaertneriomyces semiglobifer]|nr:UDP-glucose 4-epimerase [Gaertneriomyces semiglobifer]
MPVHLQTGKHILVTGGAGYIGSHCVLELLECGYEVSVLDNLSNSTEESLKRVSALTSRKIYFYKGELHDTGLLSQIFMTHNVWAVIHFAGLKSAPESVQNPLEYYRVNVGGSLCLLETMQKFGVQRLVFSSTAAVYGSPTTTDGLLTEAHPTSPINPYGRTKLAVESIIRDMCAVTSPNGMGAVMLRYFNPVGAHPSGIIGEDPKGTPGNLMPFVLRTALRQRSFLEVTGTDYPTQDGSGVRDFIHVVDLARGHVAALAHADQLLTNGGGSDIINMGTGQGTSVLQMVDAMERVSGQTIPLVAAPRRQGDVAQVVANPARANNILGWVATHGISEMCRDAWNWTTQNPLGYSTLADTAMDEVRVELHAKSLL